MGRAGAHDGVHVWRHDGGYLGVSCATTSTGGKRLLEVLLRIYGPKQGGRPVMVPVIQVNSILTLGET
jgi:hypothetical protein